MIIPVYLIINSISAILISDLSCSRSDVGYACACACAEALQSTILSLSLSHSLRLLRWHKISLQFSNGFGTNFINIGSQPLIKLLGRLLIYVDASRNRYLQSTRYAEMRFHLKYELVCIRNCFQLHHTVSQDKKKVQQSLALLSDNIPPHIFPLFGFYDVIVVKGLLHSLRSSFFLHIVIYVRM